MSDRPPALAQPPSWAEPIPPPPGAWCRALRHKLVDRAARISRLALHDVPSAGAPGGRRNQAGRGGSAGRRGIDLDGKAPDPITHKRLPLLNEAH